MPASPWKIGHRRRRLVLERARELARSGQHAGHASIVAQLEAAEGFADVGRITKDTAVCTQLDRLCTMAQERQAG